MLIKVKDLSLSRLIHLFKLTKNSSITRALQTELLDEKLFNGSILDYGGGSKAKYLKQLNHNATYHSINIEKSIDPTYLISESELPQLKQKYQNFISINTFEHLKDPYSVIKFASLSLDKGGLITLITPFLFHIHGHPDDYQRPTPSWYNKNLSEYDFSQIQGEALVWGPFTTGASVSRLPGPFKRVRLLKCLLLDLLIFKINKFRKPNYKNELISISLAFCIEAKKV